MIKSEPFRAPFTWFGGKSRCAPIVWDVFGDVHHYVEPFAGSLAVLLARPTAPRIETVNDINCFLANFWRALQAKPDEVAGYADWPVNEADLEARHKWLTEPVRRAEFEHNMRNNPDFCDTKIAGWWVWGLSCWIGGGWCAGPVHVQLPRLGDTGTGVTKINNGKNVQEYLRDLSRRLRRVRVCCGDWQRVCTGGALYYGTTVGIFLDPPYSHEVRDTVVYTHEMPCADAVREWAVKAGSNPRYRIVLCGYEGEHIMPRNWTCVPWKATGGYGNRSKQHNNPNRKKERLWFSPYCVVPDKYKRAGNE